MSEAATILNGISPAFYAPRDPPCLQSKPNVGQRKKYYLFNRAPCRSLRIFAFNDTRIARGGCPIGTARRIETGIAIRCLPKHRLAAIFGESNASFATSHSPGTVSTRYDADVHRQRHPIGEQMVGSHRQRDSVGRVTDNAIRQVLCCIFLYSELYTIQFRQQLSSLPRVRGIGCAAPSEPM